MPFLYHFGVFLGMKYDWSIWSCLSIGPIGPYLSCISQRTLALLQLLSQMAKQWSSPSFWHWYHGLHHASWYADATE